MVQPLKPALSFEGQLSLLKKRGMIIEDDETALNALRSLNYYRISGYSFQFKQPQSENFVADTSFSKIMKLYDFDSRLRNTIVRYLEIIEIYARTEIAYYFSCEYGPYGHYAEWNFKREDDFANFQNACASAIGKNASMPSIKNHLSKYSTPEFTNIPLWVLVEILSFSTISKFYASISPTVQEYIAKAMGSDRRYLENQLHCMANLRNICAHYGRIYNQELRPSIKLSGAMYADYKSYFAENLPTNKFWGYVLGMRRLFPEEKQFYRMVEDIRVLTEEYAPYIEMERLGLPVQWLEYVERLRRKCSH